MNQFKNQAYFFEQMYQKKQDPWKFASSDYERHRYEQIFNALNHKHYREIFEPGCSIGVLTEQLSHITTHLNGIDISPTAVSLAQSRCAHLKNVTIKCDSLRNTSLAQTTDLIVLSEIGYYFTADEWREIMINLINTCSPSATVFAAHWLGHSQDHALSGDEVHLIIESIEGLQKVYSDRNESFRLDRWVKK